MSNINRKTDVLIVTVTKVESESVMEVFREATGKDPRPESVGDRTYHDLGEVKGVHVFLALSEMGAGGLGASQQAVQKAIDALGPSAVIMVGIAFGVDGQKQAIGDILVSQQLWLYDLQRIGAAEIRPRGDKPHASTWLIDRLRGAELYWKRAKVRFGLVLSGEKLIDNVDYRDQLKRFETEAIGGEMEGAGLYVACQDKKVDWILVKAICDWADGSKGGPNKDLHQATAARNAASFVVHALQLSPLRREAESEIDSSKDERNDVQILVQTDKLLTSLRALDNAIHSTIGQVASCDLDALKEKRNEIITQINDFAQKEDLIDDVRESLTTLGVLRVNANEADKDLVTSIFECGAEVLRDLSGSNVTPFPGAEELRDFVMRMKGATNEQDLQKIISDTDKVLNVLDRGRLSAAIEAYGTLKGQIQLRYPRLLKAALNRELVEYKDQLARDSAKLIETHKKDLQVELETHKKDLQVQLEIAKARQPAYKTLWALMFCVKKFNPIPLDASLRGKLATDLTVWYYADGNGMFLTEKAKDKFLNARDLLKTESDATESDIRDAFSHLRTQMEIDLAIYDPDAWLRKIGPKNI